LCRRDGIPATAKILEKSLRLLFEKRDLSLVRAYVQHQFAKITAATISIQEMTFAKVRVTGIYLCTGTDILGCFKLYGIKTEKDR
jgi:DNA polymerase zeta